MARSIRRGSRKRSYSDIDFRHGAPVLRRQGRKAGEVALKAWIPGVSAARGAEGGGRRSWWEGLVIEESLSPGELGWAGVRGEGVPAVQLDRVEADGVPPAPLFPMQAGGGEPRGEERGA